MGDFCKLKIRDLHLSGGFSKRKRLIFTEIDDSQRENARFSLNWRTCEGKTCDFRLNVGFLKRKCVFFCVNWGICKEKMRDFRLNGGFEKTHDFRFNVGFSKRKRDLRINV